jgi:mannosyltransferase OCH1-like enzyme
MKKNEKLFIPNKIHQIWLGPKEPPTDWMNTWPEKNPQWEYHLWTEKNLPELYNQKQFDKINTWSGKADILRIELLYQYGGIYIDSDCECLNPLDDDLRKYPLFTCYENEAVRPGLIQNNIIGSQPRHPLLASMMEAISEIEDINQDPPWTSVGPYLWTKVVRRYEVFNGFISILPSHLFSPIHFEGMCYMGKDKIYATHHWLTTTGWNSRTDKRFTFDLQDNQEKEPLKD